CFRCPSFAQIEPPILSAAQVPFYPHMARAARVQGAVFLNMTISPTGGISSVQTVSGSPLLRAAAEENVKSWKVRWPTTVLSPTSPVSKKVEYLFRLTDKSGPADSPLRITIFGIERIEI